MDVARHFVYALDIERYIMAFSVRHKPTVTGSLQLCGNSLLPLHQHITFSKIVPSSSVIVEAKKDILPPLSNQRFSEYTAQSTLVKSN